MAAASMLLLLLGSSAAPPQEASPGLHWLGGHALAASLSPRGPRGELVSLAVPDEEAGWRMVGATVRVHLRPYPRTSWRALGESIEGASFPEDATVLRAAGAGIALEAALPWAAGVLVLAWTFTEETSVRLELDAGGGNGGRSPVQHEDGLCLLPLGPGEWIGFALLPPGRPTPGQGEEARRSTGPARSVTALVAVAEGEELLAARLRQALAARETLLELARAEGPAWLAQGARIETPEPALDALVRRSLLAARALVPSGAGVPVAALPPSGRLADPPGTPPRAQAEALSAFSAFGHRVEADRLRRMLLEEAARKQLVAHHAHRAGAALAALAAEHALSRPDQPPPDPLRGAAARFPGAVAEPIEKEEEGLLLLEDPWLSYGPARGTRANGEVASGLEAAAVLLEAEAEDAAAAARARELAAVLRGRLREAAWKPGADRLGGSADPEDRRLDASVLSLCTPSLLHPSLGAMEPFDRRLESTAAQVLAELLARDGLLGRLGPAPGRPLPLGDRRAWPWVSCLVAQRRILLGDTDGAARLLLAVVRKTDGAAPLPRWWEVGRQAAGRGPCLQASAAFAATALRMLAGPAPAPPGSGAALGLRPALPSHWSYARVLHLPDPTGSLDLRLEREEKGVRVRLERRRGEAVAVLLYLGSPPFPVEERLVEVAPGRPAEAFLPDPDPPAVRLAAPGDPLPVPARPEWLRQRVLGLAAVLRHLGGRDARRQVVALTGEGRHEPHALAAAAEGLRREVERAFEAARAPVR